MNTNNQNGKDLVSYQIFCTIHLYMYRCHESVSIVIFVAHQYPVGNILNILTCVTSFIPVKYPSGQGRHCFGQFFFYF